MAFPRETAILGVRVVQAIFSIIVLGTAAYVCAFFNDDTLISPPSEAAFLVFTATWTLLILILLMAVMPRITSNLGSMLTLGLDALTMIFWFAAWIAMATWTSDHCGSGTVCRNSGAASAFGAFTWVLFVITTALLAMAFFGGRRSHGTTAGVTHTNPTTTAAPGAKVDDVAV